MSIDTRPSPGAPERLPDDTDAGAGPDLSVGELAGRVYALFHNKRFGLALILALGLLTLLGVLFPQAPDAALDDPARWAGWLDDVRTRYRGLTDVLAFVGVFHVFSSVPFKVVVVLLALSIAACTAHRLPQLWAQATRPRVGVRDTFFDHARLTASATLPLPPDAAVERVHAELRRRRLRTLTDASGDGAVVYADRNRFAPFGTVVAHVAFVVILAGVFVTSTFGFRLDSVTVPVGARVDVGHDTGLAIEARAFTDTYHPDGSPADYASDLVLFAGGAQVAEQTVRVNTPLRWGGWSVNQASFGIAADVTVTDAAGAAVFSGAVPLDYRTADELYSYGRFDLPDAGLVAFVVTPASGQVVSDIGAGQAQFEVYADAAATPVFQQVVDPGEPVTFGDLTWTFARERQYTGLMVSRDPGAWWVWVGSLLLALGTCWSMFWRHHRIWVRVEADGAGSRVRFASPDRHDSTFDQAFHGLVAAVSDPANRK